MPAPNVEGTLASVSYAPFTDVSHPDAADLVTPKQIRADLKLIAPLARAIRTYSATGGTELVPPIAAEFDLKVAVGAWVDKDERRTEREIRSAIDLVRKNRNVYSLVIGNEAIFRGDLLVDADNGVLSKEDRERKAVDELIKLIQRAKREVQVPVSTGEIFSVWLNHPELVAAVDYIAVHILPYWNRVPDKDAVDMAMRNYEALRQAYPGKRIVIAEFGWPSGGYNFGDANPGRSEQSLVLREFVARAEAFGIDYNIIEAIDQPWKTFEGSVGPYWGLFDAARHPKFAWTGPITDPDHWKIAAIALLVGFLLSLPLLAMADATFGEATVLAVAVHAVGAWTATLFAFWNGHYFVPGAALAFGLGLLLLLPLVIIALSRIEELAAVVFGLHPRRLLPVKPLAAPDFAPKVSIHIPACREPPEMLKQTLDSVARLEYPNFECVLVINNTPDPALWRPIEEYCRELGDRFKFIRRDELEGFKAGALRLALANTAADAEIIGIIDADYTVDPSWLKELVPVFADPATGLIQAPQDHRDAGRSVMHHVMNGEYAGFFDVGMIQRNENNAIVVHGTMCLIRRTALDAAGGWSSDTICEDTDLGLAILERGWRAQYTNRRYGWGLLPDTYEAFKKQRHRWACGGAQIIRKHWRRFLPGGSLLTPDQKRDFALGWITWLGAETVGVLVAILNLIWVPVVAFAGIAIPDRILTLPIVAMFALSLVHFAAVYRQRVPIPLAQTLGAMFAAMSVQLTVAKAVSDGVIRHHLPFVRTAKGGAAHRARDFQAFWEAILGGLLIVGAIILVATNYERVREINIFAAVLVVQSLPFLAAVAMAAFEGSRANDFAFWRAIEARFAEMLPRRTAVAKAPATADKRIETAP